MCNDGHARRSDGVGFDIIQIMRISEPIAFVDLETTGANFARDRILEIGIVTWDAEGSSSWSALVNPGVAVTPFITGLTGIDDAMVADAPDFAALVPEIRQRLDGRLFVAHNARFDYGFLKAEFGRLGITFRAPVLCTVKLSRRLFPQHHRHNLDTLITRHGLAPQSRHRALADAQVLADLWRCWQADPGPEALMRAVDAVSQSAALPPHIDPELASDLPEGPGAYSLFDADGEALRIGRASNLRQQVFALLDTGGRHAALATRVRRVEWREAAGELGARLQELALQRQVHPASAPPLAWRLQECAPGDWHPDLVALDAVDFSGRPDLFGLYASRKEAIHGLRKLAEAHQLCPARLGLESVAPGKPCSALRSHQCRGVCVGKESPSRHSARLMASLGRLRLRDWPAASPLILVERDAFGTREELHVIDRWRHLGSTRHPEGLSGLLEKFQETSFDADVYRTLLKWIDSPKLGRLTAAERVPA